ncbi:MAG: helix-turn-helix transcriptional regulator [Proteobacteria bacterium]|nr:helix-turn-helix transcriptional regulator [Pseudomonadota bacterium]
MDNRIRAFREARGLSLDRLASLVDSTNQQISHLETGKRRLTVDWLKRLGAALGCHPWELVSVDLPQPLVPDEIHLLDAFRALASAQRDALLQLVDAFSPLVVDRSRPAE